MLLTQHIKIKCGCFLQADVYEVRMLENNITILHMLLLLNSSIWSHYELAYNYTHTSSN